MRRMSSANYLPGVRDQYEALPYPPRDPADEQRRLLGTWHDAFGLVNHYCFAGRCAFGAGFRALVAGGGTGDSAVFLGEQLAARGGEVVYLDISTASMEIAKARAAARGLSNIRWVHASILDVPGLGLGQFDYVNCSGVLHHLEDPQRGLDALAPALKPGGAMMIMVYGEVGRTAVYQLQELLRLVNGGDTDAAARIDHAKRLLQGLPPGNWFHHCRGWFESDLAADAGLYDLLLHSQDRAYTVPELYRWVEASGLNIASLMSPCRAAYLPATYVADPLLLARLAAMGPRGQQAACELLAGNLVRHFAYCSAAGPRIAPLDEPDNVPFLHPGHSDAVFDALYADPHAPVVLDTAHGIRIRMQPGRYTLDIFQYLDGERSLREIFELVREDRAADGEPCDDRALLADFAPVFEQLNAVDLMLLRHRSVPAFPALAELHAQMARRAPGGAGS
jgi:SAM-dependent methyltransferase